MAVLVTVLTTLLAMVIGATLGHLIAALFILKRPPFFLPWGKKRIAVRYMPSSSAAEIALHDFKGRIEDEEYKRNHGGRSWDPDDMFGIDDGWGEAVDDLIDEG